MEKLAAVGMSETEKHQIEGFAKDELHRPRLQSKVRMRNYQTERSCAHHKDHISHQGHENPPLAELPTVRMAREGHRRMLGPALRPLL